MGKYVNSYDTTTTPNKAMEFDTIEIDLVLNFYHFVEPHYRCLLETRKYPNDK